MEECGMAAKDIFCKNKGTELPGWFRAAKKWDIAGFMGDQLAAAIEMKSINSSYGNNLNNRTEEAIGSAIDAKYAIEKGLMNRSIRPVFGYALIVKKEDASTTKCAEPKEPHYKTDVAFNDTSYTDRFMIFCQRLSREGLYGAVWFVVADPLNNTVEEPDPDLSYERFIAEIRGKISVFNAKTK
jgi:hypothetical protein